MTRVLTEIVGGLYCITAPLGDRFSNLYLVVGSQSALLFDTGVNGTIPGVVVPALEELGLTPSDVATVVVSHCDVDHFGGVADAQELFVRAEVVAHRFDQPAIEDFDVFMRERARGFLDDFGWDEDPSVIEWCRSVAREASLTHTVDEGEIFDLGDRSAVLWHVPGHSRGHTAIFLPWADAALVSDAVLGSSVNLADGTPAFPPTYRYVETYLATIDRLRTAKPELLLTAHYPTFSGSQVIDFLNASEAFVTKLEKLIMGHLQGSGGLTLAELLEQLNPVAGDWPVSETQGALAFPVVGHLERAIESGRVHRAGDRLGVPVWSAS